jgi:hypothetical protein
MLNFIKIRWQITEILGSKVLAETPCNINNQLSALTEKFDKRFVYLTAHVYINNWAPSTLKLLQIISDLSEREPQNKQSNKKKECVLKTTRHLQ